MHTRWLQCIFSERSKSTNDWLEDVSACVKIITRITVCHLYKFQPVVTTRWSSSTQAMYTCMYLGFSTYIHTKYCMALLYASTCTQLTIIGIVLSPVPYLPSPPSHPPSPSPYLYRSTCFLHLFPYALVSLIVQIWIRVLCSGQSEARRPSSRSWSELQVTHILIPQTGKPAE